MVGIDLKAIVSGTVAFLVLYGGFGFFFDFYQNSPASYILPAIYIFPGFIAGAISKRNGVMNGAGVGIIVCLVFLAAILYPFTVPGSGAFGAALVFGANVVFFTSLGGLLWHVLYALSKKLP